MMMESKAKMLDAVSEALDLHMAMRLLSESLPDAQFTLECSVCDGAWRVLIMRQNKEDAEGSGWSLPQAIANTLAYLDE